MVKLHEKMESMEIGAMRFEQRLETLARFLVLLGLGQIANRLEMRFFVHETAFEPKRGAVRKRAEKPNEIRNQRHDEPNASRCKYHAGKGFVGEGWPVLQPGSTHTTE